MGVMKTTMAGLFGASWQQLTREELRIAALPVFPENTADPSHFVNPSAYAYIYFGTAAADTINGGSARDYMLGAESADVINGYGSADFINGGSGQDNIAGGAGSDLIVYDRDDIRIHGGTDIDTLLVLDQGTQLAGSVQVYSIEIISLANGFGDNLQLSQQALSASRDRELRITGEAGDVITFAGTLSVSFLGSVVENGITFDRYRVGTTNVGVQQGVIFQQGLAPRFDVPGQVDVAEGNTSVLDVTATDDDSAEGAGLIYSIIGGTDAALFAVDATTGVLSFVAPPDFEAPADAGADGTYDLIVQVSDARGLTHAQALSVRVTDVLDTAGPTLQVAGPFAAPENATLAADLETLHLTETEGQGLVYSIVGGADAGAFTIDAATGLLSFVAPPDFEAPGDADGDNNYAVTVSVTDSGGLADTRDIVVRVTDVFENGPPQLTSPQTLSVSENSTFVADLAATDDASAEGAGLTYAIDGGADAFLFSVDPLTGQLQFLAAPDFEMPGDADGDNLYELSVSVTDAGGLSSVQNLQVQVTDRPTMQFVFTAGQSLAVGTTARQAVLTTAPVDPAQALALDFGVNRYVNQGWQSVPVNTAPFAGFRPLQEYVSETHVSSMIGRLIHEYQSAGLDSPVFTHVNTAAGGRSILQLMVQSSDIYASTAEALAATGNGDIFAVDNLNGSCSYFRNDNGSAAGYGTKSGRPVFLDNLEMQLQLAVGEATRLGYDLSSDVILNWIHGQADRNLGDTAFGYEYLLGKYFERLDAIVESVLGTAGDVLGIVSQHRGYGEKGVAIDQIQFVTSQGNVVFGAPEFQFEARYPARVGSDYTHLSPEGYYMLGQQLGSNLFQALTGQENAPILISAVTKVAGNALQVDFSGVDTALVADFSIYSASNGLHPPSDLGFRLYRANGVNSSTLPQIVSADIVDADSVLLVFDRTISGDYRLYLGRSEEDLLDPALGSLQGFGGSPLRDAAAVPVVPPVGGFALADPFTYEFAPIQYYSISIV